jgi:putative serine protease PepD
LNSSGEVIGVNTAVSGEGQNIGFALPVNIVKTLLAEFDKRGGTFERPYMGVRYQMLDRQTAIANDLVEGAYIQEVVSGSPAEKAGLAPDDVITKIDGVKVSGTDEQSIVKVLLDKKIGQSVSVTYWRGGRENTANVTLEAFK